MQSLVVVALSPRAKIPSREGERIVAQAPHCNPPIHRDSISFHLQTETRQHKLYVAITADHDSADETPYLG
jgi:hypothetical protein